MADKMVPIKRTAADKKARDDGAATPAGSGGDDYPYGSRIELEHETLAKMGLADGELPKTGTKVALQVRGHISRAEDHQVNGESRRTLQVQVTHMPQRLGLDGGEDGAEADLKPGANVRGDLDAAYDKAATKAAGKK